MTTDSLLSHLLSRSRERGRLPDPAVCRSIRRAANITQAEVAQLVGVSRETISRWESGDRRPSGRHLSEYLAVLGRLAGER